MKIIQINPDKVIETEPECTAVNNRTVMSGIHPGPTWEDLAKTVAKEPLDKGFKANRVTQLNLTLSLV